MAHAFLHRSRCEPSRPSWTLLDPLADVTDIADTAALVMAVAHLAGALGRPVWLLSRKDGCWRWLEGRNDSPRYPSLRLYRQAAALQWGEVVARVADDLAALAGQSRLQAA